MKKLLHETGAFLPRFKFDLKMKLSVLVLFSTILLLQANDSYAQRTKLTLSMDNTVLYQVIDEIEANSDFRFVYFLNEIDVTQKVSINVRRAKITEILQTLFTNSTIDYSIRNKQILLKAKVDTNTDPPKQQATIDQGPIQVTGRITDESGVPLPGANIIEKGTTNGVTADFDGNFSIEVSNENAVLIISYVGYATKEVAVNGQSSVNAVLQESSEGLEEVVVIGYGTVQKSDLTGAVASISQQEDLTAIPATDVQQIMQGRAAGVQVVQGSHAPGGNISVRIRGNNSVLGDNEPLYVIDGYLGGSNLLNSINPNDIESIEILKDASATAIYGARGANGVVLVTTKRGSSKEGSINFDTFVGFQNVAQKIDLLDSQQFARLANTLITNEALDDGQDPSTIVVPFPESTIDDLPNTDWQDQAFRTAPIQSYTLSFSGGKNDLQYFLSANYLGQEGIVQNTGFERFSLANNLDKKFGKFKISNSLNVSRITQDNIGEGAELGALQRVLTTGPVFDVFDADGNFADVDYDQQFTPLGDPQINPIAAIKNPTNETVRTTLFNLIYGEYSILDNLKLKVSLGVNYQTSRNDSYVPTNIPGNNSLGEASIFQSDILDILNENTLTYQDTFGDHNLDAIIGFTNQKNTIKSFGAAASDFVSDDLETGNLGAAAVFDPPSSSGATNSLQSLFGRVNYNYKNKYYITGSLRSDYSSKLAKDFRQELFPSLAISWRVSEENFLSGSKALSNLKLRASWGKTGNERIPPYLSQAQIEPFNINSGGAILPGFAPVNLESSNLRWEVTSQYNVGLDMGFASNRLRLTLDAYRKNTTDLMAFVQLPPVVGFTSSLINVGEMKNEGIELGFEADIFSGGDFEWTANFNISSNRNEVVGTRGGADAFLGSIVNNFPSMHIIREGEPVASYFGFKVDGIDENGDLTYMDLDGEEGITDNDRTILGDFQPDAFYGFNTWMRYKGFDLNVFFQGVAGVEIINANRLRLANSLTRAGNQLAEVADYWTEQNTDATFPRPRLGINVRASDWLIEDGSYLKLRNVQLGYNLPKALMNKIGLSSLYLYLSGQNLLILTDYTGFDPEINVRTGTTANGFNDLRAGADVSSYPSARTITFGIRAGL